MAQDIIEGAEILVDVGDAHRLEADVVEAHRACRGARALDLSRGKIDAHERALGERERHRQEVTARRATEVEDATAPNVRRRESPQPCRGGQMIRPRARDRASAVRNCVIAGQKDGRG